MRNTDTPITDTPITLEGYLSWQITDRAGHVQGDGHQHNLILNRGLDDIGEGGVYGLASYCAVGTGSTAPDVAQSALVAELARTSSGLGYVTSKLSPGAYKIVFTREFDFSEANGNLTEWGFSYRSGGSVGVRELFRDGDGNPIVLTKTSEQKLRMIYTLFVTLTPAVPETFSFAVDGLGNVSGRKMLFHRSTHYSGGSYNTFTDNDISVLNSMMTGNISVRAIKGDWANISYDMGPINRDNTALIGESISPPIANPYVLGSYRRTFSLKLTTSQANYDIRGFITGNPYLGYQDASYALGGVVYVFDNTITKDDLHTLSFDGWGISWGRA